VWNSNCRAAGSTLRSARTRARGPSGEFVARIGRAHGGQRPSKPFWIRNQRSSSRPGTDAGSELGAAAIGAIGRTGPFNANLQYGKVQGCISCRGGVGVSTTVLPIRSKRCQGRLSNRSDDGSGSIPPAGASFPRLSASPLPERLHRGFGPMLATPSTVCAVSTPVVVGVGFGTPGTSGCRRLESSEVDLRKFTY
jgi:hypothetical protein